MFLRKLTVMVAPLLLCALLCLLMPVLNGLGFWSNVLKGVLLGGVLALLLPLSGAGRRREPFAGLLWLPTVVLIATVAYQYLEASGLVKLPVLDLLSTRDGQVVLVETTLAAYMLVQCLRTRK